MQRAICKPTSVLLIFATLATFLLLASCKQALMQERSIPANLSMEVRDPLFRKLTNITERFEVSATGEFKAGSTLVKGIPINVAKGTQFKCELTLPIKDCEQIDASLVEGSLWTS